jgi:predicted RNA binding protein YcfA (HicA-like mRNA interferase family)
MLPRILGADAVRALERTGFVFRSQRGSHRKLRHAAGRTVIVPMHRELAPGTLRSILRQAGLSNEQLRACLERAACPRRVTSTCHYGQLSGILSSWPTRKPSGFGMSLISTIFQMLTPYAAAMCLS